MSEALSGAGERPTLAWLSVDKLVVNDRYQRTIESRQSQNLIAAISMDFRWLRFQAIMVTPTEQGDGYYVLDGQHRVEGAKAAGESEVPAVIVATAGLQDQADAFVGANHQRVALTPYALYHARLLAREPTAMAVAAVCDNAKITIPKYPIPRDKVVPGQTLALGVIEKMIKSFGQSPTQLVVSAVADAYRTQAGALKAIFFQGAQRVILSAEPDKFREMAAAVTAALIKQSWFKTEAEITDRRARYGGTLISNAEGVIRRRMPTSSARFSEVAAPDRNRLMAGR